MNKENQIEIRLGEWNRLKVVKEVDFGLYLDGDVEGEILLPSRYVPEEWAIGDALDVFLYLDSEERLIATTQTPFAKVGDFACLEVAWVNQYGAFLNWGLMKDLFVPFREQKMRMEVGRRYLVHVHVDETSYRIVASAKVERYLSTEKPPYQSGDAVDILVWQRTDMGYKVIVDNKFGGLLYNNQIFTPLYVGETRKAYIREVRMDGKIDLSLQPVGQAAVVDFSEVLLEYLRLHGGVLALGDKSDAQDIYDTFFVSKKVFKKALGDLYKRRLVVLSPEQVRLAD